MSQNTANYLRSIARLLFVCILSVTLFIINIQAQTTAFTYQGKLSNNSNPATGNYDMQFKLFDALSGGTQIGATITNPTVAVAAGVFSVALDFGAGAFDGTARFLEIGVRPADNPNPYTALAPRQAITSMPYAMRSAASASADGLSAACVGCITDSHIETVDGTKISGTVPVESVPTGSGNYIQNAAPAQKAGKNSIQQEASFDIGGDGTIGGTVSANVVNTATQYNIGGNTVLSLGAGNGSRLGGGLDNLFVGPSAGQANPSGAANSFFGVSAGFNTSTGSANSFFGRSAGFQNTTGESNSFFGVQAGRDSSSGNQNSFFGRAAGISNTIGTDNTFVGAYAGQGNGAGNTNSFFGVSAGYNNISDGNSFFGRSAGFQNTTGYSNSFFGTQSGRDNSTGVDNSFFGRVAGINNYTGSNNTIIGSNANVGASNLFNATAIGANAVVSQSDSLILGYNVKVGIGTAIPSTKLHIEGTGFVETTIKSNNERAILTLDSSPGGQRRVWTLESGFAGNPGQFAIYDRTASRAGLTIDTNGQVGVKVLQITGGMDLAEHFEIAGGAKPGMLVAIEPQNVGKFAIARGAYNRRVAGVISGANNLSAGMVLAGSSTKDSQPVALSGRAWVYCDATRHAIQPGDLLTTSATAGHAMKVVNYARAQGAIIGKAMTGLKGGRGLVLVLVSLQ